MGNVPLCISQQADGVVLGKYSGSHADYMLVPQPALRCLSDSPDLHTRMMEEGRGEDGKGRGVGVWRRWSEDMRRSSVEGEGWEEGECDMILGLELFQDSVSATTLARTTLVVPYSCTCYAWSAVHV